MLMVFEIGSIWRHSECAYSRLMSPHPVLQFLVGHLRPTRRKNQILRPSVSMTRARLALQNQCGECNPYHAEGFELYAITLARTSLETPPVPCPVHTNEPFQTTTFFLAAPDCSDIADWLGPDKGGRGGSVRADTFNGEFPFEDWALPIDDGLNLCWSADLCACKDKLPAALADVVEGIIPESKVVSLKERECCD